MNDHNSNSNCLDLNDADNQESFELIPKGTLAKVHLKIKPGNHNNPGLGWTGGWATQNNETGSVYLSCEFTVLIGQHARRKVWSLIGLHSSKGERWGNSGRSFMKAIINSAHGLSCKDDSPAAQQARRLKDFGTLDNIEFLALIDVEKNPDGSEKNVIKIAITADHKDYAAHMGQSAQVSAQVSAPASPVAPTVDGAPWN